MDVNARRKRFCQWCCRCSSNRHFSQRHLLVCATEVDTTNNRKINKAIVQCYRTRIMYCLVKPWEYKQRTLNHCNVEKFLQIWPKHHLPSISWWTELQWIISFSLLTIISSTSFCLVGGKKTFLRWRGCETQQTETINNPNCSHVLRIRWQMALLVQRHEISIPHKQFTHTEDCLWIICLGMLFLRLISEGNLNNCIRGNESMWMKQ